MENPFTAVSREKFAAIEQRLFAEQNKCDDLRREITGLRRQLQDEVENAGRLTALCARAVKATEILERALVERQIGAQRDPSLVLVVGNLPEPAKRRGFVPLQKRKRDSRKRARLEDARRSALPTIDAALPAVPLTAADREAMRSAISELDEDVKENS